MTTSDPGEPGSRSRTFRQGSAIGSGALLIAVAAVFLMAAIGERDTVLPPYLWPLAMMLAAWAVLVRPCVRLRADGVELRNIVRDVVVTWPAIDLVESRWALTLVTEDGREFKSFAITAQRPKRGSGVDGRNRPFDSMRPADPDNLEHRPSSAGGVARQIREISSQYERGAKHGHVETVEAVAQVRAAPLGIAAMVGALACVVGALLG